MDQSTDNSTNGATEWTPDRIRELRKARGQTQTQFGLALFETTPGTAQRMVSDLERGKYRRLNSPTRRLLELMENGEI